MEQSARFCAGLTERVRGASSVQQEKERACEIAECRALTDKTSVIGCSQCMQRGLFLSALTLHATNGGNSE